MKARPIRFAPLVRRACPPEAACAVRENGAWVSVDWHDVQLPPQGWKLHVSATIVSARETLSRVLPLLFAQRVAFKVARSVHDLAALNDGHAGRGQVGKFVTIYPPSAEQAVRLAASLDEQTRGLSGPRVPTDRPLRPGSAIHYRFGAFEQQWMQLAYGEIVPAMRSPAGELEPDRREAHGSPPSWSGDPFVHAGVSAEVADEQPLIDGRFVLAATLDRSPRGAVHLALDLENARRCVIKRGDAYAIMGADGRDARAQLRHEWSVLRRLHDPHIVSAQELIESDDATRLVLEDVEGPTLAQRVVDLRARGRHMPAAEVVAYGIELANVLASLHAKNLLYRDLKPTNVLVAPGGTLRLIDFELAHDLSSSVPPFGRGTEGYMSPQQAAGETPSAADDIYALGALLYFLASGADPAQTPPGNRRPLRSLAPHVAPALDAIVTRCMQQDPRRRYASMRGVLRALQRVRGHARAHPPRFGAMPAGGSERVLRARSAMLARRLGDTLAATLRSLRGGRRLPWRTQENDVLLRLARDVNDGRAGMVLAFSELVDAAPSRARRALLRESAYDLARMPALEGARVPGLYAGASGIAAALLRAGLVLGDGELIALAEARSRAAAAIEHVSPDLFNGTAGRLRMHLILWDATRSPSQLAFAVEAGQALIEMREEAEDGGCRWRIPPGYEALSGDVFPGYAHGAAGIADALLDLWDTTGDARVLETVTGAAHWIRSLAATALDDGRGTEWPLTDAGEPVGAMWCHGATGIARFFLHLARSGVDPGALAIVRRAARTAARGARSLGPVQCHGLAGSIELLLDAFQYTADPSYLNEARSLAALLDRFAVERAGHLLWTSTRPDVIDPGFLVGFSGVACCLLRLADPERRPHILSREGFAFRETRWSSSALTGSSRRRR